jgi:hypothetical protein
MARKTTSKARTGDFHVRVTGEERAQLAAVAASLRRSEADTARILFDAAHAQMVQARKVGKDEP